MATTPVCLPVKSRKESLAGYSPWGHRESDMTEATNMMTTKISVGMSRERETGKGAWLGREKWLLSYKFRQLTTQSSACRIPGVALRSLVWHAIPRQRCCLFPHHEVKSTLNSLAFLPSCRPHHWQNESPQTQLKSLFTVSYLSYNSNLFFLCS